MNRRKTYKSHNGPRVNFFKSLQLTVLILLLLFHWELPTIIFKSFEYKYKREIKQIIKAGVPEKDLVYFKFHKTIFTTSSSEFRWIKKNEFRYKNEMYDIVDVSYNSDSVMFKCIHDFKESELFASFDKYLIDLLKADPTKRNEFIGLIKSADNYYIPVQSLSIKPFNNYGRESRISLHPKTRDGFFNVLTPPPKA